MTHYGGFWRRVAAYLMDAIIVGMAAGLLGALLGFGYFTAGSVDGADFGGRLETGTNFLGVVIGIAYFAGLESSSWQATIGKKALGMVVTDLDGNRMSFLRALGRYFAKILSGLLLGIGYIMVAFTGKKQGLHDMLAGTLVHVGRPGAFDPEVFA